MRLAVLTNMVPPYRQPMFEALASLVDGELLVLTLTMVEKNRAWSVPMNARFRLEVVPGRHLYIGSRDWALHVNRSVSTALSGYRPDVLVIGGYDSPAQWEALLRARVRGLPTVLWSGSHAFSSRSRNGLVLGLKRWFVRQCRAYLAYGSLAADYLVNLGADRRNVVVGVNSVDSSLFFAGGTDRAAVRRACGASRFRVVACCSGQLIERKGVDLVIGAMAHVRRDVALWIVGDGPLRARYERLASERAPGRVFFLGQQEYGRLPEIYGASDLFVVPSRREVWGLVVNEAMAAGLPVIAARSMGATMDLVESRGTGISVAEDDPHGIANAINALARDDGLRADMGARARALVQRFDTTAYADAMHRAAQIALRPGLPQ